jgi:hypothetical protein
MSSEPATSTCYGCGHRLLFFRCEYPFPYHPGATPRHGEWVLDHDCVADASKASADDHRSPCEEP